MHAQLLDFFISIMMIIGSFAVLMNFNKILVFCEFFLSFLINSVQDLFSYVIIKVNGGNDYGKSQGNFKRAGSGPKR